MVDKNLALLVEEIKNDGVEKGRIEAEKIIDDAKKEAATIIAKAKREAESTVAAAKNEADSIKKMTQSSARQAGVSLVASLKQSIDNMLSQAFKAIVKNSMQNDELVKKMLLSFAGRLSPGSDVEITLSSAVDVDALTKAVLSEVRKDISQGISLKAAPNFSGISVQLKGDSVKYELTDSLLKEMIFPFLSERAQSLLFPKKKE